MVMRTCLLGAAAILVSAASPTRTVSWYMWHPEELRNTMARCDNDPGHARTDPDCINASSAKQKNEAYEVMRFTGRAAGGGAPGWANQEKAQYWDNDMAGREGVLGQCAHPIQGYENPTPAECQAAAESARNHPMPE